MRRFHLCWGALIAVQATIAAVAADLTPVELYGALPAVSDPRLAPDGSAVAMIAPYNGQPALVVENLNEHKLVAIPNEGVLPNWFHWKTSNRLFASFRGTTYYAGGLIETTRMYFVDADGSHWQQVHFDSLAAPQVKVVVGVVRPQFQDEILSLLPHDPNHILMMRPSTRDSPSPEAVLVDTKSGLPSDKDDTRLHEVDWIADDDGDIRATIQIGHTGLIGDYTHRTVSVRNTVHDDWRVINEGEIGVSKRFNPVGFDQRNPQVLYVLADDENNRLAAYAFDLTANKLGAPIMQDAECDVVVHQHNYQVSGFEAPCRSNEEVYLDPAWQKDAQAVRGALGAYGVGIIDRTDDGKRVLFAVRFKTTSPLQYWLLDRTTGKTSLKPLGGAYPKISDDQVADTKAVSYKARDGLKIPALLTMPTAPHDGPIAFVVLPHGGPTSHDWIHFDWEAQFLASLGYGVLQPQFRGSSGYSFDFQKAGYQQWGLAMQDDVTDGTRWLIDSKLADPKRICIVGASYGGYAALMGAVKEPNLYACAAAFAPVTNLSQLVARLYEFRFSDINIPMISGGQSLDATSPDENAEKIRAPILLMHGRKDFTVPVEHTESMERALHRANKPVEAIYLDEADHYFAVSGDRKAWLSALQKFLAANLGPNP